MPALATIAGVRRAGGWLLVLLASWLAPRAQAANDLPFQYTRQVWHIQDGLPEETVQAIQQSPDGSLWIGTTGGLSRFDGSRFLTWNRNTQPALTENSVFCLLEARDGTLWFGTEGGGLIHYAHGVFHAYGPRDGLTDGFVRSVIEDDTGRLWIGTDNGLFREQNGVVQRVDTSKVAPSLAIHSIFEDHEHRIWVGGSRLLRFDGNEVRSFDLPGAYSQNRVKSILQTSDGTVWVGTVGGLERLTKHGFEPVPGIDGTVRALRQTSDGTLWIGTIGHGLYTFSARGEKGPAEREQRLRKVSAHGLLPSNTVLEVYEDRAHQIWLGTQDGLVRLSKTPVHVVPLPGGSDPDFETISYDGEGTVWVVSSRVYAIHADRAEPYSFQPIPHIPVRNIFRDREGTLWIGTDGSGAYHLTAHGPVHYSAPRDLVNNFVRAFLESRDGSMWIATDEGITRIAGRRVHNLRVQDGLVYFSTRALMEDREGTIWIGTDQGLSCWRDGHFVQNAATRGLAREKIWSILEDETGTIWLGTRDHGLFRYQHGGLAQFTSVQGLASNSIYQLLRDRRNQLWISSPNTISSIPLAQLDTAMAGGLDLAVTSYDMPYDADGAQLYGGRQPSGCIGQNGDVWFPSNKGAVYIHPGPPPELSAPRLQLTGVAVDGREIAASSFHTLGADAARLEIGFSPLSLRSQEDIRFRYFLEPFDRNWTYAGANRLATYTNLPAGQYRFRVVAFPLDNPAATSEATLVFRKEPHFYATWWFVSLCLVLLGLASLGAYRWRMRSLRLRFRAVLEERGRLAREMHDTVIQGCTSVSALLEAIASLERENQSLHEELLDYARTQVRTTIDEARQAVWNLRHQENEPQEDLSQSAAQIAAQTSREFGIAVETSSGGSKFAVPRSIAHEILMVIREGVFNAALHGKPTRVEIEIVYGRNDLQVRVRDNGAGFNPAVVEQDGQTHYGMAGMRERVERLNGRIEWTSQAAQGTEVLFRIRRAALTPARERIEMQAGL